MPEYSELASRQSRRAADQTSANRERKQREGKNADEPRRRGAREGKGNDPGGVDEVRRGPPQDRSCVAILEARERGAARRS